MKRNALLFGSLLLNAGLIAFILWQSVPSRFSRPDPAFLASGEAVHVPARLPSSSSGPGTGEAAVADPGTAVAFARIPGTNSHPPGLPRFDWRQVESEDYRTYLQNLRTIGCPEQTVQDIVTADLRQAFAARRAEVMARRFRDFQFWNSGEMESVARTELESARRTIDEELGLAVHELLGPEASIPPTTIDWQRAALDQQLAFLPEEKRQLTESLLLQYAEVDAQIRELASGHATLEKRAERQRLLESYGLKKSALESLLSPAECEQVELTTSWTAYNLRRAMAKFQPTEEEFRAIFREWRAHDENLAVLYANGAPDPGNAQVFANIANILSPERFAFYKTTWWK